MSRGEKHAAELAACRVKGVKAVAEEIDVKLAYDYKHSDEDIAAAAVQRLAWNTSVPRDAVKIKVEKGWVTLAGEVDWRFQKDAAAADVRWTPPKTSRFRADGLIHFPRRGWGLTDGGAAWVLRYVGSATGALGER